MTAPDSAHEMNPQSASETLAAVQEDGARAANRGRFTRSFAIAYSLWGGALCATVALPIWPLLLIAGLAANHLYRNRASAWIHEVPNRASLRATLGLGMSIGALFVVSFSARVDLGEPWISWAIGIAIAVILYSVSEIAYGAAWDSRKR